MMVLVDRIVTMYWLIAADVLSCHDADSLTWTAAYVAGQAPAPRSRHTSVLYDKRVYLFGGGDDSRVYNDLFAFDPGTVM